MRGQGAFAGFLVRRGAGARAAGADDGGAGLRGAGPEGRLPQRGARGRKVVEAAPLGVEGRVARRVQLDGGRGRQRGRGGGGIAVGGRLRLYEAREGEVRDRGGWGGGGDVRVDGVQGGGGAGGGGREVGEPVAGCGGEERGEQRVGGDDAFGLEGAQLQVEALDLAVELGEGGQ